MSEIQDHSSNPAPGRGSFFHGSRSVLAIALVHFLFGLYFGSSTNFFGRMIYLSAKFVGVTQLIYVIPLYLSARKQRKSADTNGIAVAAAIVFILNAGCWGIL